MSFALTNYEFFYYRFQKKNNVENRIIGKKKCIIYLAQSTTLIDSDDDSAKKVTRANRSFRVSKTASDQPARPSRGHVGSKYISAPRSTFV